MSAVDAGDLSMGLAGGGFGTEAWAGVGEEAIRHLAKH